MRVSGATFCTKRGRTCARPGVRVAIDLSLPAKVTGNLSRQPLRGKARARRFGTVSFGTVAAGPRTLTFSRTAAGKRLAAGRYTLTLNVTGAAARTLRFKVR